jgi:hypothetical protein
MCLLLVLLTELLKGIDALEDAAQAFQCLPRLAQGEPQPVPQQIHGGRATTVLKAANREATGLEVWRWGAGKHTDPLSLGSSPGRDGTNEGNKHTHLCLIAFFFLLNTAQRLGRAHTGVPLSRLTEGALIEFPALSFGAKQFNFFLYC